MMRHSLVAVVLLLQSLVWMQQASADMILSAVDSGTYSRAMSDDRVIHYADFEAYGVRYIEDFVENHNFFVFDLSSVSGTIEGAVLSISLPLWAYSGPPSTFALYDVSTDIDRLRAGGNDIDAALLSIWEDLGSGTQYSDPVGLSEADEGTLIEIVLNADALESLNASEGSLWAVGGTLVDTSNATTVFYQFDATCIRELALTVAPVTAPLPGAALLGLIGLGYSGLRLRRKA